MIKSIYLMFITLGSFASFSFIEIAKPNYIMEALMNDNYSNSTFFIQFPTDNKTEQMLQRGNIAMGFDQYKITHKFIPTENGGEIIILPTNSSDLNTLNQIREHMADIQSDFSKGNFTKPFFIHAEQVPGTKIMNEKKDLIEYDIREISNGSVLSMNTKDKEVIDAIKEFMDYQGSEHTMH